MHRHHYGTVEHPEVLGCLAGLLAEYFSGHDTLTVMKKADLFGHSIHKTLAKQASDPFLGPVLNKRIQYRLI